MPTIIYHFDHQTGEYSGETSEAKLNHDKQEMIPPKLHKSRTAEPPPEAEPGHAVCRVNGEWVQVECYSGKLYDKTTGVGREAKDQLGPLPDHLVKAAPSAPYQRYNDKAGVWVDDAERKAAFEAGQAKKRAIDAAIERVANAAPGKVSADDIAVALGMREMV